VCAARAPCCMSAALPRSACAGAPGQAGGLARRRIRYPGSGRRPGPSGTGRRGTGRRGSGVSVPLAGVVAELDCHTRGCKPSRTICPTAAAVARPKAGHATVTSRSRRTIRPSAELPTRTGSPTWRSSVSRPRSRPTASASAWRSACRRRRSPRPAGPPGPPVCW
jgi:hypothetical protein